MSSRQTTSDLAAVVAALRAHDGFLVTTHENPDGDALGSLLAMKLALDRLGKDAVMYLAGPLSLPQEYAFMRLDELGRDLPDDAALRVLIAVDCANESRLGPDPEILMSVSRFGDVNLVVSEASSTGEVLRDVFRELGLEITPDIAEALYIALVTDTGRFQYTNTTPKALRLAAELVEAGANIHKVFQGGRIVVSNLRREDFTDVGAAEPYAEGIIDYLRAVEGADMAVLIREPPRSDGPTRRVSLRASVDELDVSAIARKWGGGGHRQAAGFSTDAPVEEVTASLCREFAAAAGAAA